MPTIRLRSRNPGPPPQDVMAKPEEPLTPAELARAERVRDVQHRAIFWGVDPTEMKRWLFAKWLFQKGRVQR